MGDNLFKEVYADKEGKLMVYTGRETDLYYNEEFVVSIDSSIKTVKEETITTSNNKKWKIKWFGNDVVEMTREGTQRIIKDNYSGISKTYDKEYIPYEELLKDLKYFTSLNY